MRVDEIGLKNFGPYRGENDLRLGPSAYGVFARKIGEQGRSNFLGKSMLLEAIAFALWGWLNKDRRQGIDGWISRGEKEGSVRLKLSDGTVIVRSRKGSGSTQLKVSRGEETLIQDAAQKRIEELLGMSEDDFFLLSYMRQRQMARIVLSEPGPRMEIVSGWLKLGPVEAAHAHASETLADIASRRATLAQNRSIAEQLLTRSLGPEADESVLKERLEQSAKDLEEAKAELAEEEDELQKAMEVIQHKKDLDEYKGVVEEGKKIAVKVASCPPVEDLERRRDEAQKLVVDCEVIDRKATEELRSKEALARGEFSGKCPVVGIECPAAATIRGMTAENKRLAEKAVIAANKADSELSVAKGRLADASRFLASAKDVVVEYEQIRKRALEAKHRAQASRRAGGKDVLQARSDVDQARARVVELGGVTEALKRALEAAEAARREVLRIDDEMAELQEKATAWAEAARILGKNGAQRVIAESGLSAIEAGANEILAECGIGLTVQASWAREGDGLARACEKCGLPFPTSRKIKVCDGCGAERGPHLVNKLELDLSDRSGAAEDLVGIALQISASRWLRRRRGSAWAVMMIDEPFGQLDEAHRMALSTHLSHMFLRGDVEQAFVVAHHSSVLEALPGRIDIVSSETSSTLRVTA